MASHFALGTRDVQRLRAALDQIQRSPRGATMPRPVLEAVRDLVPCDDLTYQVTDPAAERLLDMQDLFGEQPCLEPSGQRLEALFWETFWSSPACSYPQRTNDFTSVRRVSDFYSPRALAASGLGELFRLQGVRYEMLTPLPPDRGIDHRLLLWRFDGPDFSDRDHLLLTLLRPHLAELDLGLRGGVLTLRQAQLLELVADGLTNRQIASRLRLSEGTVRRHLENIFERLGVNSRTAAARAVGAGSRDSVVPYRADAVNGSTSRDGCAASR